MPTKNPASKFYSMSRADRGTAFMSLSMPKDMAKALAWLVEQGRVKKGGRSVFIERALLRDPQVREAYAALGLNLPKEGDDT